MTEQDRDNFLQSIRNICMEHCKDQKDGKEKDRCYSICIVKYDYDCLQCLKRWNAGGIPQCTLWGHTASKYGELPK